MAPQEQCKATPLKMITEAALGVLAILLAVLKVWAAQVHERRRPDRRRTHLRRATARHATMRAPPVVLPGCGLWRKPRKALTL